METDYVGQDATRKAKVQKIKDALAASHTPCFQAIDAIRMGSICLLASGLAQENTSTVSGGLDVLSNTTEVGTELNACLPWYDALCLTGTGISISEDLELTDDTFKKNAEKYRAPCELLKSRYATDNDLRKEALINNMLPLDPSIFPQKTIWDSIKGSFTDIAGKTKDWFKDTFSRRLLGSTTFQVKLKAQNDGSKLVTYGKVSGVPLKDANAFLMIVQSILLLVFVF